MKYTICCGISVTTLGFLICQLLPRTIIHFFTTDEELIALAEHGVRIMVIMLPVVGFQMVSTTFFQSIGMAGKSIFLSLTRQLIFLVPCLFILPIYWGTDGIWSSFPIADGLATITTGSMLGWQLKKIKSSGFKEI